MKNRFQNLPFKFNLQRYTVVAALLGPQSAKPGEAGCNLGNQVGLALSRYFAVETHSIC
jgi:hypothetical protein